MSDFNIVESGRKYTTETHYLLKTAYYPIITTPKNTKEEKSWFKKNNHFFKQESNW